MPDLITTPSDLTPERRRIERRASGRLADLTLPEVRRILITTLLSGVVLGLFFFMVRAVVVAAILGVIIGFYTRPLHLWLLKRTSRRNLSAMLTLTVVILPVLLVLVFSYSELSDVVSYTATHQQEITAKVDAAIQRLPFLTSARAVTAIGSFVATATAYLRRADEQIGMCRVAAAQRTAEQSDRRSVTDHWPLARRGSAGRHGFLRGSGVLDC